MMERILRSLRWVSIVAVVASFVGGLLMLYVGASGMVEAVVSHMGRADIPEIGLKFAALIRVVESLDAFLVALALLIFSGGVYSLFILEPDRATWMPEALRPRTLGDLKQTLAEIIVLVLFVLYLDEILRAQDRTDWALLLGLPVGIALLGLAIRLVNFTHKS